MNKISEINQVMKLLEKEPLEVEVLTTFRKILEANLLKIQIDKNSKVNFLITTEGLIAKNILEAFLDA